MKAIAAQRGLSPAINTSFETSWRLLAIACLGVWLLVVGSRHEPWFDESQAWLLARDNGLWQLLAHRVRYEGTPGLWHAVLWLAIRAGLPFRYFFVVPATFALAGAAVVLWRAPFPSALRLAFVTSYFYGYQYSVVARSYCLDLLLMPLAATFFARRVDRPMAYAFVVGLIANANTHGFLIASMLALELAWQFWRNRCFDRESGWIALATVAALCLIALFCAWQPSDNDYLRPGFHASPVITAAIYLCHAFVDHIAVWNWDVPGKYDSFACVILSCIFLYPVAKLAMAGKNKWLHFAIFTVVVLFSILVYAKTWHAGLLFLLWMFVLWVEWDNVLPPADHRAIIVAMGVILSLQAVQTVRTGLWDMGHVYSPGRQAAAALLAYQSNHPHARIDGYGDFAFDLQPWLDGNPYANYHNGDKRMSYVLWDRREPWMAGSWNADTHLDFWHKVLADRPDLIVASPLNRLGVGGFRADLVPEACAAGYAVRDVFEGTSIWRGMFASTETLYLFEKANSGTCVHATANARPTKPNWRV